MVKSSAPLHGGNMSNTDTVKEKQSIHVLLFELRTKEGHTFKLFLDGRTEGFPDGTILTNHALPLFYKLYSLSTRNFTGEISSPSVNFITNE
jgi:hypothetical protein